MSFFISAIQRKRSGRPESVILPDHLSKVTRVPKSRLLDEAIEDLLKKYEKKDG